MNGMPTAADPRYNLTDPVVLAPLEVERLASSAPWLANLANLAYAAWVSSPDGIVAEMTEVEDVVVRFRPQAGIYTLAAPPIHPIWIQLAEVQSQLAAEVLVRANFADLDRFVDQYALTRYVLEDEAITRAQFITFLLMQGVSQYHRDNMLVVDLVNKVIERYKARAATGS